MRLPVAQHLKEINVCEVCGSTDLTPVLDLGSHALCDDLVKIDSDRVCTEFPIEILYCATCQTAHQRFQVAPQDLFPADYHYRAKHTQDVLNGMKALVKRVAGTGTPIEGRKVLDVGCNDGSLLGFFRDAGAQTFGIEPTGAAEDAKAAGHDIQRAYFSPQSARDFVAANGQPDIITFTNVFAHIDDLGAVLEALSVLIGPRTLLVVENHYLGAILQRDQFDTFYHEHPRTYSLGSFVKIAERLGLSISRLAFPARYGGNVQVLMSRALPQSDETTALIAETRATEATFGDGLARMQGRVEAWKARKSAHLAEVIATHGPIRAKAFPGRSAIPVKLLGLDVDDVRCVFERDTSIKVDHFVPGTRIPIGADAQFDVTDEEPVLNLAWHIRDEIHGFLRRCGFNGPIIDIIGPGDFEATDGSKPS